MSKDEEYYSRLTFDHPSKVRMIIRFNEKHWYKGVEVAKSLIRYQPFYKPSNPNPYSPTTKKRLTNLLKGESHED